MSLEQSGLAAWRFRRTIAARTLDPSEKGAVSYFLGLTICKLFAARLLDAPWMLHLDVFRPKLNPVLTGRSRPDLVGQTTSGQWVALECKGRISKPNAKAKTNAKAQAQRLVSVNGSAPSFHIGGIAYFKKDVLQFFWRDPEPDPRVRNPIEVSVEADAWRNYYAPTLELIRSDSRYFERMTQEPMLMPVGSTDINIGIHPMVLRQLVLGEWEAARHSAAEVPEIREGEIPYQADGIAVVAGESWRLPFAG
jgi:hypothetical protein